MHGADKIHLDDALENFQIVPGAMPLVPPVTTTVFLVARNYACMGNRQDVLEHIGEHVQSEYCSAWIDLVKRRRKPETYLANGERLYFTMCIALPDGRRNKENGQLVISRTLIKSIRFVRGSLILSLRLV